MENISCSYRTDGDGDIATLQATTLHSPSVSTYRHSILTTRALSVSSTILPQSILLSHRIIIPALSCCHRRPCSAPLTIGCVYVLYRASASRADFHIVPHYDIQTSLLPHAQHALLSTTSCTRIVKPAHSHERASNSPVLACSCSTPIFICFLARLNHGWARKYS